MDGVEGELHFLLGFAISVRFGVDFFFFFFLSKLDSGKSKISSLVENPMI